MALDPVVLRRLVAALGEQSVLTDPEQVDAYRDPYWIPGDDSHAAAAVVTPTCTEEVQAVMRIANDARIPVWPHSQGRNNGYGGPAPRVRGSLQISLRRMNRVLEINDELAYAVVEPGVRWFDLHDALAAGGHELMASIPDIGWGSVIGNAMDNGITYLPQGADFGATCGMEVVLPDGDVLRTGMGAMPGNAAWHVYKRGLGPVLDPLFCQSNLGIVTRMGVWLMRTPQCYRPLTLTVADDADLPALIDTVRELRLDQTLEGVPAIFSTLTGATLLRDRDVAALDAAAPDEQELAALAAETGLGAWAVRTALWGDEPIVAHKLDKVRRLWRRIPGSQVITARSYRPDEYAQITNSAEQIQAGIPTMQVMEALPENLGHIGFSPVLPLVGQRVGEAMRLMRDHTERAARPGLSFLGGTLVTNARSCIVVLGIQFDRTDPALARGAYDLARTMVADMGARGYGEYRAHLDFMDTAAEQYSFNDHAYRRFVTKIKDAVDPNGVLSPGRHGIWPGGEAP